MVVSALVVMAGAVIAAGCPEKQDAEDNETQTSGQVEVKAAALRGRLTRSLAQLESRLSKLTAQFVRLDEEKARLRGTIQALIGQIKLDAEQI